jgi:homoserine O-acetyltransferase
MLVETVRADPDYDNGNYTAQPRMLRFAKVFFDIATSGGTQAWQAMAPTGEKADLLVKERLMAPFDVDANDFIWQWASSRDYDAAPGLEKITAPLLAINAADDERNPPETGVMAAAMQKVANGKLLLIPASTETRGHGTTGAARFYATQLGEFLDTAPRRGAAT